MKFSHLHVSVRDLSAAVHWFESVAQLKKSFDNGRMAVLVLAPTVNLVLDTAEHDAAVTLAWESADCDGDFAALSERGAVVISAPEDLTWGVRAAYLQGPGAITIELEQSR